MPRLVRSLPALACALGACAVAAPTALAAPHQVSAGSQTAVVLSASHGTLRLVDRKHRVKRVRVASTRGVRRGAVVAVRHGRVHVTGRVHKVSFYGRVVRSSAHGAVLRLADGSHFKIGVPSARHGARAAATVTVDVQGLAPGQEVLITISTDGQGNVALTIKLIPGGTGDRGSHAPGHRGHGQHGGDQQSGDQQDGQQGDDQQADDGSEVDGVVTAIAPDGSSLTLDLGDGSPPATVPVPDPTLLDGVSVGDQVAVITDDQGNATEIDVLDSADDGSGDPGQQGDGGGDPPPPGSDS